MRRRTLTRAQALVLLHPRGRSLGRGLVAHWRLEEASGTRFDSRGVHHLTDNNTVGQTTGKVGSAAALCVRANNEYLSLADTPALRGGDRDFTLALWVKLTTKNTAGVAGRWKNAAAQYDYQIVYDAGADRFLFVCRTADDTATVSVVADTFGAPSAGVWHLIVAYHAAAADRIGLSVNAGPADTATLTGGTRAAAGPAFILGAQDGDFPLDAALDSAGFWSRVLSEGDRARLYNDGAGREWPF